MYSMDGLELYNPVDNGSIQYDADTEAGYIKSYCWSHFNHLLEDSGEIIPLYHYPFFPYILFGSMLYVYTIQIAWRFVDLTNICSGT